jgi:membrane fusion protein (multidrug efflux system)
MGWQEALKKMEPKSENSTPKPRKKKVMILVGVVCLGIGLYFGIQWLLFRWHYVSTDDAQVKGNLVNLSAKVSGRILQLRVEEGDLVQAGRVLVEIDPKDYLAAQAQVRANLEMARHDLAKAITQLSLTKERVIQGISTAEASFREAGESLKFAEDDATLQTDRVNKDIDRARANLQAAKAKVLEAKATLENAKKEFDRSHELFRQNYVAETARDTAETAWQVAQSKYQVALENERDAVSQLEMAEANQRSIVLKKQSIRISEQVLERAKINVALSQEEKKQISLQEKNIELLKAKVQETEAALQLADLHLQETKILSPISGVISKRLVDQGQVVQVGQPLLIVNNPGEKWVVANVEETKVRRIHQGAKAKVEVDAFPGRDFEGRVEFVGSAASSEFALLPSENPSGNFIKVTHRIPVRVSVKDPKNMLKPGMMVVVAIEGK